MLSKYHQGSLHCCQLGDEPWIPCKLPYVPFIASVEENGSIAFLPVLIYNKHTMHSLSVDII